MWPHGDHPLIEVGRLTPDRNPEDRFVHVEQAAFEPSNLVPGIGVSPDEMLLGRIFSYPDAHRYRIGPTYAQLPPNRAHVPVHSYGKDGPMRFDAARTARPYAPNSYGGPAADPSLWGGEIGWSGPCSTGATRTGTSATGSPPPWPADTAPPPPARAAAVPGGRCAAAR